MKKLYIGLIGLLILGMLVGNCYAQVEEQADQENQQQDEGNQQQGEQFEYTMKVNDQDFSLSEEQYTQLLQFFQQYDVNGDGYIDRQEIVALGKILSQGQGDDQDPSEEEISELIGVVDQDKDGVLSFSEFISLGFMSDDDHDDHDHDDDDHDHEGHFHSGEGNIPSHENEDL